MTPVEYLQKIYDSCPTWEEHISEGDFEEAKQMEKQRLVDLLNWMHEQDTMFLGYTREAIVDEYLKQLNEE